MGLEEFVVGDTHRVVVDVAAADVERFAELSGDRAPLHMDSDFARAQGFAGPLVHGAFLVALVSRLVGMEFPGDRAVLERVDLSFRKPCYAPCTLEVVGSLRQISEAVGSIVLDITINEGERATVATGKTWHRILNGPAHP